MKLDEHLTLIDDEKAIKFTAHIYEKGLWALRQHLYDLKKEAGNNKDNKEIIVGHKYKIHEAIESLECSLGTITCKNKSRQMTFLKDAKHFSGIQNFPKLILSLMLRHEYVYDYITYCTLSAEIYP